MYIYLMYIIILYKTNELKRSDSLWLVDIKKAFDGNSTVICLMSNLNDPVETRRIKVIT